MSDHLVAPDGLEVARTLDAKGLSCPMPLLRTKKEIDKINSGDILEILAPTQVPVTIFPVGAPVPDMSILVRLKTLASSASI